MYNAFSRIVSVSEVNLGPVTTGIVIYPLGELSVAQDSSWRGFDEVRVDALKVDFKAGKYGVGNFSKPSVLISACSPEGKDEAVISDIDGLVKLDNGKSTIKALKDMKVAINFTSCPISLNCTIIANKSVILRNWVCLVWKLFPDPVAVFCPMPYPPHYSIMKNSNARQNCTFYQPPSNNVLRNPLRPSPPTNPPPTCPMPKAEFDENEKKEPEKKEVLEWAQGDLLFHITEGTRRSCLGSLYEGTR